MNEEIMANGKYFCQCCGYNTLERFPDGSYEICEICYWEDDIFQTEDPECDDSPNNQARKNFEEFGACIWEMKKYVRNNDKDIRRH